MASTVFPVKLKVNFKGETATLLLGDAEKSWKDIEAMVKKSFNLRSVQVKYIDEDNEEVSVNTEEEYKEGLKCASKQGNQLSLNVYALEELEPSTSFQSGSVKPTFKAKEDGKNPVQHYTKLAKMAGQEMLSRKAQEEKIKNEVIKKDGDQKPPQWFISYMEQFKHQFVEEAVETISQQLCEKLNILLPRSGMSPGVGVQVPEISSTSGNLGDELTVCSACHGRITGMCYQCSVCSSFVLCESCELWSFDHDSSHTFIKVKKPVIFGTTGHTHAAENKVVGFGELARPQARVDRIFRKAEKQRLKAEKRQLKAEVKEIKKQLKLERRGLHLSTAAGVACEPPILKSRGAPATSPVNSQLACSPVRSNFSAVFLDENLPDGTHLQPGTKFIKHWRMNNTGNVSWTSDTKLKFMWGNLSLASVDKKEVSVPFLQPGQVGIVSVVFVAPNVEGTYTSHWRLAHKGEQFGPRVWCSIVVDPQPSGHSPELSESALFSSPGLTGPSTSKVSNSSVEAEKLGHCGSEEIPCSPAPTTKKNKSVDCEREYYIPSVDLLTAQDLLSFELLDINIVQELERVPHNTPVDMTPCMSPLPLDGSLVEKPGLGQIEEETEGAGFKAILENSGSHNTSAMEDGEDDISSTQFVCETVIRSLTLEEAPDHKPPRISKPSTVKSCLIGQDQLCSRDDKCDETIEVAEVPSTEMEDVNASEMTWPGPDESESRLENMCTEDSVMMDERQQPEEDTDDVQSQGSSSSSEDYIIILPECFDTSRPIGESMYSSALSQPGTERGIESDSDAEELEVQTPEETNATTILGNCVNDMLCTSQTLDTVPLTPEVVSVPPPRMQCEEVYFINQESVRPELAEESSSSDVLTQPSPSDIKEGSASVHQYHAEFSGHGDTRQEWDQQNSASKHHSHNKHKGIAGGLVKGALSVAASAYKALFTGQQIPAQAVNSPSQDRAMMAVLLEMGFGDRHLNQRLLKKHNYNIMDVVNELVQMSDGDWYSNRY
ncbi:NBR1 autophagy cargo receptor a isoform X2 [Erpetoichthys calabaricus]|uniref:NBR1 autophagy cargo receptor a isoform X2 n=1 Tax=Erpetoichthys calabaricus TaxID=27687 RepID=UPI00223420DD|nr:NBR1 autophagy cargo receptor a isoform X2 [Erpetoichthys calabaricus]